MKVLRHMTKLGLLMGLCLSSNSAEAFLSSIKTTGMGACGVAYPQDALYGAYNPAGGVQVGNRIDGGLFFDHKNGSVTVTGNPVPVVNGHFNSYTRTRDFYNPDGGINYMWNDDIAIGFCSYNNNQAKTTYKTLLPLFGTTPVGLEYVDQVLATSISYKLSESQNIGLAINYHIARIKVDGLQNFDNALFSSAPGHVTNRGYNYSNGINVVLGYQWRVTDCLTVGATWTPETSMKRFNKYRGFVAERGRLNSPEKWSAGFAWRFVECATFCFQVDKWKWSKIPALHNPVEPNLELYDLGTKNGVGFGFRDQMFWRVGMDYALSDSIVLRLGYRYANGTHSGENNPTNVLLMEEVRHALTCGGTYYLCDDKEISFMYARGFQNTVKGRGAIPVVPFRGGNVDIRQRQNVFGFAYGFHY